MIGASAKDKNAYAILNKVNCVVVACKCNNAQFKNGSSNAKKIHVEATGIHDFIKLLNVFN